MLRTIKLFILRLYNLLRSIFNHTVMAFTGKEGSPISAEKARIWKKNYLDKMHELGVKEPIHGEFFGCDMINRILAQSNKDGHCKGIRIHYGVDDKGVQRLLLLGATENENNMWPERDGKDGDDNIVGDGGTVCPPACGER